MGMIRCAKHGLSGIVLLCCHLHDSYSIKNKINKIKIDEYLFLYGCDNCLKMYNENIIYYTTESDADDQPIDDFRSSPICVKCFNDYVSV